MAKTAKQNGNHDLRANHPAPASAPLAILPAGTMKVAACGVAGEARHDFNVEALSAHGVRICGFCARKSRVGRHPRLDAEAAEA